MISQKFEWFDNSISMQQKCEELSPVSPDHEEQYSLSEEISNKLSKIQNKVWSSIKQDSSKEIESLCHMKTTHHYNEHSFSASSSPEPKEFYIVKTSPDAVPLVKSVSDV